MSAGADKTTVVSVETVVDRSILDVHIPSIDKVCVETISCRVSIGEYKLPSG